MCWGGARRRKAKGQFIPFIDDMPFDTIYPIGSVYLTISSNFNPNTAEGWNGQWTLINETCALSVSGPMDPGFANITGSNAFNGLTEQFTISNSNIQAAQIAGSISTTSGGIHYHNATSTIEESGAHDHSTEHKGWITVDSTGSDYAASFWNAEDASYPIGVTENTGAHSHNVETTISEAGAHYHSGTAISNIGTDSPIPLQLECSGSIDIKRFGVRTWYRYA